VEETFGMAWRLFATMLERAETTEAVGLNWARLHSTRPQCRTLAQDRIGHIGWIGHIGYFFQKTGRAAV
jgi:hypothetical protein